MPSPLPPVPLIPSHGREMEREREREREGGERREERKRKRLVVPFSRAY